MEHNTSLLEEAMNPSLDLVAKWMNDRDLRLSIAKIEAIMMITKRGYQTLKFFLEDTLLQPKDHYDI